MDRILWNYSGLRKREKKIYSVAGTQISSTGISVTFLKVVAPMALVTTVIGIIICVIVGKNFFNPLGPDFSIEFLIASVGSGIALGLALWYIKVDTYRLYEYLVAYLRPKKTFHSLNQRNNEFKLYKITEKGIINSDL